jgi:hypothetical protein
MANRPFVGAEELMVEQVSISSNVAITHSADKKDFRFLPEFPNHKIQISNNI